MKILNRVKQLVLSEWGRRITYTVLAAALVVVSIFGPTAVNGFVVFLLAAAALAAYHAKADDIKMPGWRRAVYGVVATTVIMFLGTTGAYAFLYNTPALEWASRVIVLVGALAVLVVGAHNTAEFIEREVNKELEDD